MFLFFQGVNDLTETLLKCLNASGQLHCVPASLQGRYVIRFTVTSQYTTEEDIERDWSIICMWAGQVLQEHTAGAAVPTVSVAPSENQQDDDRVVLQVRKPSIKDRNRNLSDSGRLKREGLRLKSKEFGMSLILSNVPMSPKFINGSFAALFDDNNDEILVDYARHLGSKSFDFNGQPIRLSPRKRLREQPKQYSFDLSLVPTSRRNYLPNKQGSLDSKIEEIFETSFDSSVDDPDNGEGKQHLAAIDGGKMNGHLTVCQQCGSTVDNQKA